MRRLLALLAVIAAVAMTPPALAVEPGSKDDPIVTRSYLESLYSWQVTSLQDGQTIGLELGVQFVVRSGNAVVVGTGSEGLIDLTAGSELKDGERIPPFHLILSPAGDHRGVRAVTQVVLLTRGLTR